MLDVQLHTTILRFDTLPSTNTEAARQAAQGAPEGLCVVARAQTRGRGRLQRAWVSPADAGLYFSIVLRPRLELSAWPIVSLAAALAVRDALTDTCSLVCDIKWPNDLLADGRKLCGILAETIETPAGRALVLGIGINLSGRALPHTLRRHATSVEAVTDKSPDAEEVLRALVRHLARRYARLHEVDGQTETIRAWSEASSYATGERVSVDLGVEIFEGLTRGLEPDGALRVETHSGEMRIVRAGDVRALRVAGNE